MKNIHYFLVSLLFVGSTVVAVAQNAGSFNSEEFMKEVASGGMMEVQLGEMAAQKAVSQEVKEFGQRMVEDHSKANEELKQLASTQNVTLPTTLMSEHQKTVDKLSGLSGEKFDKAYMKAMVKDHDKDIKKFQKAAENASEPELKSWAEKTLMVLEEHHLMAKEAQEATQSL